MPWTISAKPSAMTELYRLPRGKAAVVNDAIHALLGNPTPTHSVPVEGIPDTYRIEISGIAVEYQVDHSQQRIRVLAVY